MSEETGLEKIDVNSYIITCKICGKRQGWYGILEKYKFQYRYGYITKKGNHSLHRAYCCSWSCYVKGLLESTERKQRLDAQDVLLLLRYHKPIPYERVAAVAWEQLPSRQELERESCCLK